MRIDNLIFMKTTMTHTFFPRWTAFRPAAIGAAVLVFLTACGGGGGGGGEPAATVRFEPTTVGAASGIRDNSTGIVWAAQLSANANSPGLLPSANELMTLADAGAAVISTNFSFLVGKEVPTNETLRNLGVEPWVVSFTNDMRGGLRNDVPLAGAAHWRVLQRPTPTPPTLTAPDGFQYDRDGLVTQAGVLMWRLCTEGTQFVASTLSCTGVPSSLSLTQAKALPSSGFGGYSGWRLPTKQELQSLLKLSNPTGTLLAAPFKSAEQATLTNAGVLAYWTSTAASSDPASDVWAVDFSLDIDPGGVALAPVTGVLPPTALVRLVRNLR